MTDYYALLSQDVRLQEGLKACMNCGICTAVCPAAEYYTYDPRQIVCTVASRDNAAIEALLKSETIWYCGECMSCRPRCPRGNTPGYVIQALRGLSQRLGFFVESEKGRQQLVLKRTVGENILNLGYCVHPQKVDPALHPEQGPVWSWIHDHDRDIFGRFGENYCKPGAGAMRKIDDEVLAEVRRIFDVTGGTEMYDLIEKYSEQAARKMGMDSHSQEYIDHIFTTNNGGHHEY